MERLLRWPLMKIMMLWETCSTCMVLNLMKLKTSEQLESYLGMQIVVDERLPKGTFMISTPVSEKAERYFDRLWREGKECSRK